MAKTTIDQVQVRSRRVLMRVDFNVPLADGRIRDDRRIAVALSSIRSVTDRGGRLVLISHLGRPQGQGLEPGLSLAPCAAHLGQLVGQQVALTGDAVVRTQTPVAAALRDGQILLLENLRFHPGEKSGDPDFARRLAALGDIYCNEAFGTCHRNDASMVAVPRAMAGKPRVMGLGLAREIHYLGQAIESPTRPFVAILGGAKVSDKLTVVPRLLEKVDTILVGGAMAYTFLAAAGRPIGDSNVEPQMVDQARQMLAAASGRILLPIDSHCGDRFDAGCAKRMLDDPGPGWMGLDIGPRTIERFTGVVQSARTILFNGPMGVFEMPPFDTGTREVARAIACATASAGTVSIVGGGDSAAAIEQLGLAEKVTHLSTGGGASLAVLEGHILASIEMLDEAPEGE